MNDFEMPENAKGMNRVERWMFGAGATVILTLMGFCANYVRDMSKDVKVLATAMGKINAQLELAPPKEVLTAIYEGEKKRLTKDQVVAIMSQSAPWLKDKPEWERWRYDQDKRVRELEMTVRDLSKQK